MRWTPVGGRFPARRLCLLAMIVALGVAHGVCVRFEVGLHWPIRAAPRSSKDFRTLVENIVIVRLPRGLQTVHDDWVFNGRKSTARKLPLGAGNQPATKPKLFDYFKDRLDLAHRAEEDIQ